MVLSCSISPEDVNFVRYARERIIVVRPALYKYKLYVYDGYTQKSININWEMLLKRQTLFLASANVTQPFYHCT